MMAAKENFLQAKLNGYGKKVLVYINFLRCFYHPKSEVQILQEQGPLMRVKGQFVTQMERLVICGFAFLSILPLIWD